MPTKNKQRSVWKFENLRTGFECTASLVAYWEVSWDPISDDFTPEETSAEELFVKWSRRVGEKYDNGLIPISWFVDVKGDVKTFEFMPFQFEHFTRANARDFLTFFSWPVHAKTGKPLNWLELPVVDKLWRPGQANKGGFIQEATGWKPSILQPYVYLPSLEKALRAH